MLNRLLLKLMGAFLLVIVIGALVIYLLTTQATQNAFRVYTTQNSQLQAQRMAPDFAAFYVQTNSWQGVDAFLQAAVPADGRVTGRGQGRSQGFGWMAEMGMNQRLILADAQDNVIADTSNRLIDSQLSAEEIAIGAPVTVDGVQVGTLIVAQDDQRTGPDPASTFLATVNRSILISVLVAGILSLALVFFLSIQIIAPVRQMRQAAAAIARGDLHQRVPMRSQDELGELAQSFNEMAGSLADAEVQRRTLIADVAHELRTPLAVIQAHAEGMQDGVLPVDLEQVSVIHVETLLLARLIEDLRLVSLAEAGELRLERQPADLTALLESAIERFQPQCSQKGVTLRLTAEEHLPLVHVDIDRINQVLNNLIGNAIRYTPETGEITLSAAKDSQGANPVRVSVTDSGSGIAREDLPWVFDRFYRADKSRARASGGSGLGLAIVRQLVAAHGGQVWAESPVFGAAELGYGTRITFTLPAARSAP